MTSAARPRCAKRHSGNDGSGILAGRRPPFWAIHRHPDRRTGPLGNGAHGVNIGNTRNATVGGTAPDEGNIIAFNGQDGVFVQSGTQNTIRGNAIHSNAGLCIDLGTSGVRQNDPNPASCPADADTGANNLQNFPVLTSSSTSGGNTTITGTLNSTGDAQFTIDFYSSAVCDPSGYGEGKTYLGSTISRRGNCNAPINVTLLNLTPSGPNVTATATDAAGNTSEFSTCVAPVAGNQPPNAEHDTASTDEDVPITINVLANDTDPDGDAVAPLGVTQGTNGSVVINVDGTVTYSPNPNFNGEDQFTHRRDGNNHRYGTVIVTLPQRYAGSYRRHAAPRRSGLALHDVSATTRPRRRPLNASPSRGRQRHRPPASTDLIYTPNRTSTSDSSLTPPRRTRRIGTATVIVTVTLVNDTPPQLRTPTRGRGSVLTVPHPGARNDSDVDWTMMWSLSHLANGTLASTPTVL